LLLVRQLDLAGVIKIITLLVLGMILIVAIAFLARDVNSLEAFLEFLPADIVLIEMKDSQKCHDFLLEIL